MLGPGAYNTIEEEKTRKKYLAKHEKLLAQQVSAKKGLVKVGKNLVNGRAVPEFEETQKKLQEQFNRKYAQRSPDKNEPGPGAYAGIKNWQQEWKRRSYNLRYF